MSKRNFSLHLISFLACFFSITQIQAQSLNTETNDTLRPLITHLQTDIDILKKIKFSGFMQMDYQHADTAGISSYAGGNFNSMVADRMNLRRCQLKLAVENKLSLAVIQFYVSDKTISIKDAYLAATEPYFKSFSMTAGLFDRPFGYEIAYSANARETPERVRIFQTLFPGEKDFGAKIAFLPNTKSTWKMLKLEAGLFNGNSTGAETDDYKDFIGHITIGDQTKENLKWSIGYSYYNGGFASTTQHVYAIKNINGVKAFQVDSVSIGQKVKREYFGFDGQLGYNWILGNCLIRAEYLWGTQPATASASTSLQTANTKTEQTIDNNKVVAKTVGLDAYSRNFMGYYIYFIQNIGKTPLQAVVKYDVYDPNTDISGNEIGKTSTSTTSKASGEADIKYTTWGFGLNYCINKNIKCMAYYDWVTNETTSAITNPSTLKTLSKDRQDNVFTFRIQYKF